MKKIIKSIKGMNDYTGEKLFLYNYLIKVCKNILKKYCYKEIKTPIIENTKLFEKSIGNNTDIIEKEMYSFLDKNNKKITLRPEGTSGCMRSIIENNLLYINKTQKLWYFGQMFRHENTQRGRYREFHQFGVETIGIKDIYIELETILITIKIWKFLGILNFLNLEINSIGSVKERKKYKKKLNNFLEDKKNIIKKHYKKNYKKNPFRLFESNNYYIKKMLKNSPKLFDSLSKKSLLRFQNLENCLKKFKIKYYINKNLVRGLNYYNDTVFEWKNKMLKTQQTICAGGRYDKLSYSLNKKCIPAFGFAIGIERLIILMDILKKNNFNKNIIDIEIIYLEKIAILKSLIISEKIRKKFPKLKIFVNFSSEKIKKKLRKSNKNKVKTILFIGNEEIKNNYYTLKNLKNKTQKKYCYKNLIKKIYNLFEKK
ncbi:histidine--tRNA ligase [Buchnera aphidicola (Pseudoregma panicola)]|uniref:histidine--tRNA ligase n=1 Tax=Buchnera aphidicola TaxID=9 RepID=UPI0031B6BE44